MNTLSLAESTFERGYKMAPVGGLIFTDEARARLNERVGEARARLAAQIQKAQKRGWSKDPVVLDAWKSTRQLNKNLQPA